MKGQVVIDFIVDHNIKFDSKACVVVNHPWKLFFMAWYVARVRVLGV
jgi:hypothetical protein